MATGFNVLPLGCKTDVTPFKAHVSDEEIDEFRTLLKLSKVASHTYESLQHDRRYGITTDWLITTKDQWLRAFDWRATEARINSFPQFMTEVEELSIHFVALFSQKEDAIPVILLHGWPGSFLEFLPLLQIFREEYIPSTLPYHFIVPSMPGYAFSSGPPLDRNFTVFDVARIFNKLMNDLGFGSGYVAQGGDIGSSVGRVLAVEYASCKAVHLNLCIMQHPAGVSDETLTATEVKGLERFKSFYTDGLAYALEHGTRTSTIGHVLASNPLALLAWVGEKFLDWVDEPLEEQTILDSVSLYWFTNTFPRAIYPYRERPKLPFSMEARWFITKPLGFSYFPMELTPLPKSWIATTGNLVFWREHTKGGHFAALEQTREFKTDLCDFIEQVWSNGKDK